MHLRMWKVGAFLAVMWREKGTLLSRLLTVTPASASGASGPPSSLQPNVAACKDNTTNTTTTTIALGSNVALRFLQLLKSISRRVSERILNRLVPVVFFGAPTAIDIASLIVFSLVAVHLFLLSLLLRLVPSSILNRSRIVHTFALAPPDRCDSPAARPTPSSSSTPLSVPAAKLEFPKATPVASPNVDIPPFTPAVKLKRPVAPPPPPPPPPPPRAPHNTHCPSPIVILPPSGFRVRPSLPCPPCKLRRLHWRKLPNQRCVGSAWQQIDAMGDVEFSKYISLLYSAFGVAPKITQSKPAVVKKQEITFCNDRRAQVILVAMFQLRSFDHRPQNLVEAITSMDAVAFTENASPDEIEQVLELRLQGLQICFATSIEKSRLSAFNGDRSQLRKAERWLLELNAIAHFEERIRFWLLKSRFDATVDELEVQIRHLQDANAALERSESFKHLLQLVLEFGNVLNAGTASGCSFGFQLSTLQQLQRLRSTDNKKSLLQVLAAVVLLDHPHIRGFLTDFKCMQFAAGVDTDSMKRQVTSLQDQLRHLEAFMSLYASLGEGDGVLECFGTFLPRAQTRIEHLFHQFFSVLDSIDATAVFFGEAKGTTKPEDWFGMLFEFSQFYRSADEDAQRHQRLQESLQNLDIPRPEDSWMRKQSASKGIMVEGEGAAAVSLPGSIFLTNKHTSGPSDPALERSELA